MKRPSLLIQDNIMTGPELGMPTTVGSAALRSAVARKNAPIVDMVRRNIASLSV